MEELWTGTSSLFRPRGIAAVKGPEGHPAGHGTLDIVVRQRGAAGTVLYDLSGRRVVDGTAAVTGKRIRLQGAAPGGSGLHP